MSAGNGQGNAYEARVDALDGLDGDPRERAEWKITSAPAHIEAQLNGERGRLASFDDREQERAANVAAKRDKKVARIAALEDELAQAQAASDRLLAQRGDG